MNDDPHDFGSRGGTATAEGPEPVIPPAPPVPPAGRATGTPPEPGRRRPGSVRFAIALIFLGVLLLIAQLVPGLAWWHMWPLIIIAAGLVQAVTPGHEGWNVHRFFDGLVTVAFGLVFLAITTGLVGWGVWWTVLGLWPVLLISIGFDILGKSLGSSWLRVLGSLAVIAALAYAVAIAQGSAAPFATGPARSEEVSLSEELGDEDEAVLRLKAGAADISLEGDSGTDLVRVEGSGPFGRPQLDVERDGADTNVEVTTGDPDIATVWPGREQGDLFVTVSEDVLWDASIETGVSTLRADLRDVPVRSLVLKPGVADCTVTVGDVPDSVSRGRVDVEAGVSTVRLRLPRDAEVRLETSGGLSTTDVDRRLEPAGDRAWETPGFADAEDSGDPVWVVSVESGIGAFDLSTY